MADQHTLKGAKIYIDGKKICDIKTVEITQPQEPVSMGMDLSSGPDRTATHLTGTFDFSEGFINPGFLQWLVKDLAETVRTKVGCSEQTALHYVMNRLGVTPVDLECGRRLPLNQPTLTGDELMRVTGTKLVDDERQFRISDKPLTEHVPPLKNVRPTKDATPWTHKREPWRTHRPKRGKR